MASDQPFADSLGGDAAQVVAVLDQQRTDARLEEVHIIFDRSMGQRSREDQTQGDEGLHL